MKKFIYIIIFIMNLFLLFILFNERISYSFLKSINNKKNNVNAEKKIKQETISDIEDNIYIPPIKNFKEIFLKKINFNNYIEIVIPENVLKFYRYNNNTGEFEVSKIYPVSVGRYTRQTEIGDGIIYTKGHIYFKHHYGTNQGKIIPVGHDKYGNPFRIPYEKMFGLYMIINQTDKFVIHSTTETWRIGMPVSSGCVRMLINDMLELYPLIHPVIKVSIRYRLFKLESNLLTAYPDIYKKTTDIYHDFIIFLKEHKFDPIIFDKRKIKQFLYADLPYTTDLNDLLINYFSSRNITVDKLQGKQFNIRVDKEKEFLPKELKRIKINEY